MKIAFEIKDERTRAIWDVIERAGEAVRGRPNPYASRDRVGVSSVATCTQPRRAQAELATASGSPVPLAEAAHRRDTGSASEH